MHNDTFVAGVALRALRLIGPKRRRRLRATLVAVVAMALGIPALAHQPHDVVGALALSPAFSRDGVVFASLSALVHSNLARSTDGGLTWRHLVNGLDNAHDLVSIAVSPNFENDRIVLVASDGDGIFRSTDGGDSWTRANDGLGSLEIHHVACAVNRDGRLIALAAAHDRLFRSDDGGSTWRATATGVGVTAIAFAPDFQVSSRVYVGDATGRIFVSNNGGRTWPHRYRLPRAGRINSIAPSPHGADHGVVFVGTSQGGVLRISDGDRIEPINQGLGDHNVTSIALSPRIRTDRTLFAATGTEAVYRSTDGGDSWTLYHHGLEFSDQGGQYHYRQVAVSDGFGRDGIVFLAAFEGLFRSENRG